VNQVDLIAFLILFVGIIILAYPLFILVIARATEKKSSDLLLIGFMVLLGIALIIALWAVYLASTSPELLWPLAVFTLLFRFISPLILVRSIMKWRNSPSVILSKSNKIFSDSFPGIAMVIGTFILLSPYMSFGSSESLELLIATSLAIFTFSQFYLFLFVDYMRKGNIPFAWIAGFFIGVGLVIMVPQYLNGFDSAFRITSSFGWFSGAIIMLYGHDKIISDYLQRIGW
jgi:hypothetical protein